MQPVRAYPPPVAQRPLFTTFTSNFETFEQENYRPPSARNENFADFPEPAYGRKQSLKRSFSDVVHTNDRPLKNKVRPEEDVIVEIPEPHDMPTVEDDGGKPSYSYAQMIGMAILRAPNRRLTLSQIYEWISSSFAFYREDTKQSWHNSIRHNLSLNKNFDKVERPKGDAGKGSYWIIVPGAEHIFLKDKPRKTHPLGNMSLQPHNMRSELPIAQPLAEALAPNPWLGLTKPSLAVHEAPALPELSSDATLPASDDAPNDNEDIVDFDGPSLPQAPPSSPPQAMNSSPPAAAFAHRRTGSSPGRQQRASSGPNRKRTRTMMDDSGYFSSLESSVLRPNKPGVVLTSEIDLEPLRKKKRGRAEDEILRIRSSSPHLTPSHRRFRSLGSEELHSSSPVRPTPSRLNPMTPSVVFKKPNKPPPSISPNTQLRNHRKALQEFSNSPLKGFGLLGSDFEVFSPVFKLNAPPVPNQFDEHFDIYSDAGDSISPQTPALGSSPLKSLLSANKRPSLTRASTTANVLSEVTSGSVRYNAKTPSKMGGPTMLRPTAPRTFTTGGSPLKFSSTNPAIFSEEDDLFNFDMFADENSDDGEGVDILKGFQKIGGGPAAAGVSNSGTPNPLPATAALKDISPQKFGAVTRPGLGARSLTSRF